MSSRFVDRSPLVLRALGGLVGGGFGALMLALTAANATRYGGAQQYAVGVLLLILGGALGWLYAPRAARPGTLNAAATAGRITALAVPLGALLFSLLLVLGTIADSGVGGFAQLGVPELVGGIVGMAFVGLIFLGLPMAGLTFVVASIWVFIVRFAVARLGGREPGPAPSRPPVGPADDRPPVVVRRGRQHGCSFPVGQLTETTSTSTPQSGQNRWCSPTTSSSQ